MFFSIVIPTYNSSEYIHETIDSLRSQTFKNFEIIIVDDNSSDIDELLIKINYFISLGMDIKISKQNYKQNAAKNRNIGISLAHGNYICFLDADDTFASNKLEEVSQTILSNKKIESMIIYHKVNLFDLTNESINVLPKRGIRTNESFFEYIFINRGFLQTSSIVLSKKLAKNLLFDEKFKRHQDYDFCIRAKKKGIKFFFINKVLSNYRVSSQITIKDKGESVSYSKWWLAEMQPYLSRREKYLFELFFIGRKYYLDREFYLFIKVLFFSVPFVGFGNILKKLFHVMLKCK